MTLKLGTQTASMTNHIYSRMTKGQPEPEVGMGATVLCWTDRHAATIVQIITRKGRDTLYVIVKEDTAKRIDSNGLSESQAYEFSRDPNGREHTFRRNADGSWQNMAFNGRRYAKAEGPGLRIGERDHYHDFSF